MSELLLSCPWCKSAYKAKTISNCNNCGGSVQAEYHYDVIGPKPPDAPRNIPKHYIKHLFFKSNLHLIAGGIIALFGIILSLTIILIIPGIILLILGLFFLRTWYFKAMRTLQPLKYGQVTQGEITSILIDSSVRINGVNPYLVEFKYFDGKTEKNGQIEDVFSPIHSYKKVGDKVWVVYNSKNYAQSAIWPPLV